MKIVDAEFFVSWAILIFAIIRNSTDAYETTGLSNVLPFYLISLASFCIFLISWNRSTVTLAVISAFYQSSIVAIPYLKYPFLYGTVYDTVHHYILSASILQTGHLPYGDQYYGFTAFHSTAAISSIVSGLPLMVAYKATLILLPAFIQLSSFWVSRLVTASSSVQKLSIISGMIAFAQVGAPGPQLAGAFITILILTLVLEYASQDLIASNTAVLAPFLLLGFGVSITHHQTAFFTILDLIAIGLLVGPTRKFLRTEGSVGTRALLVGLVTLGFAYLWWTYYAGFTGLLQTVGSNVASEQFQFQTPVGKGILFYGPLTWAYRTIVLYAQRGQTGVWTVVGLLSIILALRERAKTVILRYDAEAVVFLHVTLWLFVWTVFFFIPYVFVISDDRFFNFAFVMAPSVMAVGIYSTFGLIRSSLSKLLLTITGTLPRLVPGLKATGVFLLLVLVFVDFTSHLLLGGISAAGSQYQASQIAFIGAYRSPNASIVSHVVISNQMQLYSKGANGTVFGRGTSVQILYAIGSQRALPTYAHGSLILLEKLGPAGRYFEAVNYYDNDTWVNASLFELLVTNNLSLTYNSGEAFIASLP